MCKTSVNTEPFSIVTRIFARPGWRWLAVAVAWSVVGFLSAAHWHFFFLQEDPYTWWELLRIKLLLWFMWGGFTLWILRIGRRFRPEGATWGRNLIMLVLSSVVVVGLYLALYTFTVMVHLGRPLDAEHFESMGRFIIWTHSTFYYLAFWTTVGVGYAFDYFRKYRERELQTSRLRSELTQAQLQSLRAKLHPHFLFNALNAISSMVQTGDQDRAYDTIAKLADLLRSSLNADDAQIVPLDREIEFTERYLEILQARFAEQLEIDVAPAQEALSAQVPSLILQPLVENAVKHGMRANGSALRVSVTARREAGDLVLEVSDNGKGLASEWEPDTTRGFGLRSTMERLKSLYGERQSFGLRRDDGNRTVATVRIPYRVSSGRAGAV